jgi:hypothetical protein
MDSNPYLPRLPSVPKETEEKLLLSEVFEGRLRSTVAPNDEYLPLIYTYDFGVCSFNTSCYRRTNSMIVPLQDNWDHELIFKGSKMARAARPLFSAGTG